MKVGILQSLGSANPSMLAVYEQILDYNNIEYVRLDINDDNFWSEVKTLDLFLAKVDLFDDNLQLAEHIWRVVSEQLNIPCFPSMSTVWHYDNKVKQYYMLKNTDFRIAESFIYWNKKKALDWAENTSFPKVFKLKGGAGSSNVTLIRSNRHAKSIIKKSFGRGIHPYFYDIFGKLKSFNYSPKKCLKYFVKPIYNKIVKKKDPFANYLKHKNYVYFQEFYGGNDCDIRVAIVGDRAWAFKRFTRPNDFRASGSNNYDCRRSEMDMDIVKIAFDVSKQFNFQSMAYDFVYDEKGKPIIVEISYTYGDYPEFSNGYWDRNLHWHDGSFVPEYLELKDALKMETLKQPKIELTSDYKNASMLMD